MPSFKDLVGKPLIRSPTHTYDHLYPSLVGEEGLATISIEITVQKNPGKKRGLINVTIDDLCPMCDQPLGPRVPVWFEALPVTTLDFFPSLLTKLWNASTASPRATNPQGRKVNKSLNGLQGLACLQHQYEAAIIPLSIQYQWPRFANYFGFLRILVGDKVRERARLILESPWSGLIISRPVPAGRSRVLKDLVNLASHEFIKSAGYYGLRGWAIAMRYAALLLSELEDESDVKLGDYFVPERFIEFFVLPEIVSVVIAEEYQCTLEGGLHMAWLSDPFGLKEYPFDNECLVLRRVQAASSTEELRMLVDEGEDAFMTALDEVDGKIRAPKRQKIKGDQYVVPHNTRASNRPLLSASDLQV